RDGSARAWVAARRPQARTCHTCRFAIKAACGRAFERRNRSWQDRRMRPHVLGIDDGPFEVRTGGDTPIVGVMTEGPDVVEAVAVTRFPVDGDAATDFLAAWVTGLRLHPARS